MPFWCLVDTGLLNPNTLEGGFVLILSLCEVFGEARTCVSSVTDKALKRGLLLGHVVVGVPNRYAQ